MADPVGRKTNYWHNDDGLYIPYGADEVMVSRAGAFHTDIGNGQHCVEFTISLPDLPAYDATADSDVQILDDTVTVPSGAFLEKLEVLVTKETTGTNANLDIGLVDQDRVTEIDFDGIMAAGDDFNAGTDIGTTYTYVQGTTDHGALIGTKLTNTGLLTARADTASFTAGILRCRLYYSIPLSADL